MIQVYVWNFQGSKTAWGHTSMLVRNTYMSWWPEGEGRQRSKIHPDIYFVYPIRYRTFQDDVEGEDGRDPDHRIEINGLDEEAILDWWQSFGLAREGVKYAGPPLPWSTFKINCSTVVAMGLKKGGGDRYASLFASRNVIWRPDSVLSYARDISETLKKRNAGPLRAKL